MALHRIVVAIVLSAFAAAACGEENGPASPSPTSDAGTSDGGADASDASSENEAGTCTTSADCRLFENTCGTCSCRALPAASPEPTCSREPVSCFAPSCTDKVATCVDKRCGVATR